MSNGKGSANTRVRNWSEYRKTCERLERAKKRREKARNTACDAYSRNDGLAKCNVKA